MTDTELEKVIRALSSSSKSERLQGAYHLSEVFYDFALHPFDPHQMTVIVEYAAKTEDREVRGELLEGIANAASTPDFESVDLTSLVELLQRHISGEVRLDACQLADIITAFTGTSRERFRHLLMPLLDQLSDSEKVLISDDLVSLEWFWEERPLVEQEILEIVRCDEGLTIPELLATSEFTRSKALAALNGMEVRDVVSLVRECEVDGRSIRKDVTVHWRFYGRLHEIRVYGGMRSSYDK